MATQELTTRKSPTAMTRSLERLVRRVTSESAERGHAFDSGGGMTGAAAGRAGPAGPTRQRQQAQKKRPNWTRYGTGTPRTSSRTKPPRKYRAKRVATTIRNILVFFGSGMMTSGERTAPNESKLSRRRGEGQAWSTRGTPDAPAVGCSAWLGLWVWSRRIGDGNVSASQGRTVPMAPSVINGVTFQYVAPKAPDPKQRYSHDQSYQT